MEDNKIFNEKILKRFENKDNEVAKKTVVKLINETDQTVLLEGLEKLVKNNDEKYKYYTPNLKDFHVGFEFEHYNWQGKLIANHPNNLREWNKEVCDSDWFNILLSDYEHDEDEVKNYRVKYLDKSDIESCGWESFYIHEDKNTESFIKNIKFCGEDLEIQLAVNYISHWICIGKEDTTRFSGYIKNLLELKVLLKQLNIV